MILVWHRNSYICGPHRNIRLISICVEVSPEVITDIHLESQNVIPAFLWDKLCELASRNTAC